MHILLNKMFFLLICLPNILLRTSACEYAYPVPGQYVNPQTQYGYVPNAYLQPAGPYPTYVQRPDNIPSTYAQNNMQTSYVTTGNVPVNDMQTSEYIPSHNMQSRMYSQPVSNVMQSYYPSISNTPTGYSPVSVFMPGQSLTYGYGNPISIIPNYATPVLMGSYSPYTVHLLGQASPTNSSLERQKRSLDFISGINEETFNVEKPDSNIIPPPIIEVSPGSFLKRFFTTPLNKRNILSPLIRNISKRSPQLVVPIQVLREAPFNYVQPSGNIPVNYVQSPSIIPATYVQPSSHILSSQPISVILQSSSPVVEQVPILTSLFPVTNGVMMPIAVQ